MNSTLEEISTQELKALLSQDNDEIQLIDVREYPEYAAGHLIGARLMPLGELSGQTETLERKLKTILMCRSGKRSAEAQNILRNKGMDKVCHLQGGLLAWEQSGETLHKEGKAPWALERQVRVAAGSLVLLGVVLSWVMHPGFIGISAFVGAGLVFAGVTDWCGMGLLLAKMPWNQPPKIS